MLGDMGDREMMGLDSYPDFAIQEVQTDKSVSNYNVGGV